MNPLDEVGLAAVLEALPDGVVVLDAQVRVVWVNAEFRRLTGWALAEVVGRSGLDLLDPAQLADCLLYTSPSPRDRTRSRMPSSA